MAELMAQSVLLGDSEAVMVQARTEAVGGGELEVVELDPVRVRVRPVTTGGGLASCEVKIGDSDPQAWPVGGADDSLLTWVTRTRLHEDQRRPRLHAAALTDDAGRAVVVLGDPGAGKSTLTAHLAHGGLDLVTDEQLTVFADHGLVGAFTRPVLLKRPSLDHLPAGVEVRDPGDHPRLVVPAADLGSRHRLWGRPVLVVLPERADDHHGAPTWDLLTPAAALAELCGHNLDLVRKPVAALDAFAWLAATVPLVRLRYRDAVDAAPVLAGLLAQPPDIDPVAWQVSAHDPDQASSAGSSERTPEPAVAFAHSERPEGAAATGATGAIGDPSGLARVGGVVTAAIGREVVLFEPVERGLVRLNEDGARLWASLPWSALPWEVALRAATDQVDQSAGQDRSEHSDDEALAATYEVVVDLVDRGFAAFNGPAGHRYRRVAGLVSRRLGTEELVSDPQHRIARLDGAAAVVWRALAAPARPHELVARIALEGGVDPAGEGWHLATDARVREALSALVADALVEIDPTR